MNLQTEILQWCKEQPLNVLKHIATLKSPVTTDFIKKILSHSSQTKPIDRLSHGYSQTIINNEKGFYVRDKFRHKKHKQQKNAMDKQLLQNLTISRTHPYALSIKRQFIESQGLKRCMLLLSDNLAFNFIETRQFDIKTGGQKVQSLWFYNTNTIRSFSEWIVYLLEIEIYEGYKESKGRRVDGFNHFSYVEERMGKEEVRRLVGGIVKGFVDGRGYGKSGGEAIFQGGEEEETGKGLQVTKEEAPYLIGRCLEAFEGDRGIAEVVFQYQWYCEDRGSKVNRVLKELCRYVVKKFRDQEITIEAQKIDAMSIKKKKKKSKKKNEKVKSQESQEKEKEKEKEKQENKEENGLKKSQAQEKPASKVEEERQQHAQLFDPKLPQTPQKPQKVKSSKKTKPQRALQQMVTIQKQQSTPKIALSDHKHPPEPKKQKQTNQRTNEYIQTFQQQLTLSSQSLDKYRKMCLQTIESSISQIKVDGKWKVLLFGSYQIDFALRGSDLDVVVVVEKSGILTLNGIKEHFNVQKWLRRCNVIQIQAAKVDILEFQVMLGELKCGKVKDRRQDGVIHVDLSIITEEDQHQHQGLRNTAIMREIFDQEPNLKAICLIFKELLSLYELNKPFTGGIGSYYLVILVHNIIKMKKIDIGADFLSAIIAVCAYMTEEFKPYKSLISASENSKIEVNAKLELNIVDYEDSRLLDTIKMRQVSEIVGLLDQFKKMLRDAETELRQISLEERKKMKRVFFSYWNVLFRPDTEANS